MSTILMLLAIICSILLILIVLIQNPKGGGISSGFASPTQIGGVKQSTEFVEKATWGLAIAILAISLLSNIVKPTEGSGQKNVETSAPAPTPGGTNQTPVTPVQ